MRHFLSGLLFVLLTTSFVFAQNAEPIYSVEIGTFIEPQSLDFAAFADDGIVYTQTIAQNTEQVYLGGFTDLNRATEIVQKLQQRGYLDAQVVQLDPSRGMQVTVIQLRLHQLGDDIDWNGFSNAGKLFCILKDRQVKVVTGTYNSIASAKEDLARVRKLGYGDAFVKNINAAFLHEVDEFIAGPLPNQPAPPADVPTSYEQPQANIPADVPTSYEQPTPKTPPAPAAPTFNEPPVVYRPEVRGKVKRNSVRELQAALTSEKVYSMAIDGYYGNGTVSAFYQAFNDNYQIQKYSFLSQKMAAGSVEEQVSILQGAINGLATDPQGSLALLQQSQDPLAKGYYAYHLFVTLGPSLEVNTLMNQAIQQAFGGKRPAKEIAFDPTSTYAYQNLGQLLLHLRHLHAAAADPEISVPCWIFDRHPSEALNAFQQDPRMTLGVVRLQNCGGFLGWEEIGILVAMTRDMNGGVPENDARIAQGQATMLGYALNPTKLSESQAAAARQWQNSLQIKLMGWSAPNPMLADMAVAFKLLYFQTLVLLEDYYMDKGLKVEEAEALGIATLQALLGPRLAGFV
jgi:peptidoglycan hydrolase-like protein with peptidoglycan-binding domain